MKKACVVLLMMCFAVPAVASVSGTVSGGVISKDTTYGSGGMINQILLVVDTYDGWYWAVTCHRSDGNLGLCSGVIVGDSIEASGGLVHHSSFGSCSYPDLHPSSIYIY